MLIAKPPSTLFMWVALRLIHQVPIFRRIAASTPGVGATEAANSGTVHCFNQGTSTT